MIGLHYSKRSSSFREENLANVDSYLIKEKWHRTESLLFVEGDCFDNRAIASLYDGYPISKWEDEDALYVVEGIIFNIPENEIREDLKAIANEFSVVLMGNFVKKSDGDFIVLIYKKSTRSVLLFNDELGGLPFHYYCDRNSFIAGRNCTYIAALSKDAVISKQNMAELLCFNYNMAERTIFEHIIAFTPAMFIICEENQGNITFTKGQTVERSYALSNPFKTKEDAISTLKDLFIEGTRTRCEYARSHGYEIVNTMSGGYDSRTVLGGIEACMPSEEYQNMTYEYDRDESSIASEVLKAVGSNSEYIKLSYKNIPDIYNQVLSFNTEGKIATYTNSVCYNDLVYSYNNHLKDKRILYFGGFGGEFIRHPLFANIWNASNVGSNTSPTLMEISKLCDIKYKDIQTIIKTTFKDSHTKESFCKQYYDEYYRRYVRGAGEERIRMFYFSVQPLMSKSFILTIRNRVPLKWVGFEFYTDFLKAINPNLVSIGIHGGVPDIHSKKSLRKLDFKRHSFIFNIYRWYIFKFHVGIISGYLNYNTLLSHLNNSSVFTMLDKDYLEKNFSDYTIHTQCKIAAFLFYVDGLNKIKRG